MYVNTKEIEIRYGETDQMGVVYHANYIIWMELGRAQLIRDLGYEYGDLEKDGYVSPVMDLSIKYKAALRYGQKVFIKTWIKSNDRLRTTYEYEILHEDGTIAATAESMHILVTKDTMRPVSLKKVAPQWFAKYEEIKA